MGYSSTGLVAQMRENGNAWQQGEVSVKLAKAYGYCWGVERAVRMAYEARQSFPTQKIFITNEIIHNPEVNDVRHASCMHGPGGLGAALSGTMQLPSSPAMGASAAAASQLLAALHKSLHCDDQACRHIQSKWLSFTV